MGKTPNFYTGEPDEFSAVKRKRLITVMLRAGYRHSDIVRATGYSLMTVKRVSRVLAEKPPPQYIVKPWEEMGLCKTNYFEKLSQIPEEEKERANRERLVTVMLLAGGFTRDDIAKATGYSATEVEAVLTREKAELLSPKKPPTSLILTAQSQK